MEIEVKRLYGENIPKSFDGNKIEESDLEAIYNDLLDVHDYDTGDLTQRDLLIDMKNGYQILLRKINTVGAFDRVTIYRTLRTKQTPLFSTDGNFHYQNDFLMGKNVFYTDTDFVVKIPGGNVLNKTNYSIGVGGKVTFGTAQTYPYLLLENIRYEEKTELNIVRNSIGQIVSFSTIQS